MKKFKNSRLSTDSRKLQTLALKMTFINLHVIRERLVWWRPEAHLHPVRTPLTFQTLTWSVISGIENFTASFSPSGDGTRVGGIVGVGAVSFLSKPKTTKQ